MGKIKIGEGEAEYRVKIINIGDKLDTKRLDYLYIENNTIFINKASTLYLTLPIDIENAAITFREIQSMFFYLKTGDDVYTLTEYDIDILDSILSFDPCLKEYFFSQLKKV